MSIVLSSFFWTYALAQLPSGWLSDRFGARFMLGFYLAMWSLFTGLMGLAHGFAMLVALRLGCGLFEAGAYPTAAGIVRNWLPFHRRGLGSGIVSIGGRFGGAAAPLLTAFLLVAFMPVSSSPWRPAMMVYGVIGLLVACVFGWLFRNKPRLHPQCNDAEAELIEGADGSHHSTKPAGSLPFLCLLTHRGLWASALVQFLTNIGWAFLITWLPGYLEDTYHVPSLTLGLMTSLPIFVGMAGMFWGGWLTDYVTSRIGKRWGRAAPLSVTRFMVAGAFAVCLFLDSPWPVTIAMAGVALATDLGTPALWAFAMDIGGKHVGSVLGFSNMCGNVGAALSPILLNRILERSGSTGMFMTSPAHWRLRVSWPCSSIRRARSCPRRALPLEERIARLASDGLSRTWACLVEERRCHLPSARSPSPRAANSRNWPRCWRKKAPPWCAARS